MHLDLTKKPLPRGMPSAIWRLDMLFFQKIKQPPLVRVPTPWLPSAFSWQRATTHPANSPERHEFVRLAWGCVGRFGGGMFLEEVPQII